MISNIGLQKNNLVQRATKIIQVESFDEYGINLYSSYDSIAHEYFYDDLSYIPATEDWLLKKLGFEKDFYWHVLRFHFKANNYREVKNSISINLTDQITTINSSEGVHEVMNINVTHCEFVHQIQNLYFSLNNKELPINFNEVLKLKLLSGDTYEVINENGTVKFIGSKTDCKNWITSSKKLNPF